MTEEMAMLKQRVAAAEELALAIGADRKFLEERLLEVETAAAHVRERAIQAMELTGAALAEVTVYSYNV